MLNFKYMEMKPMFHMRPLMMAALGMLLGTMLGHALDAPGAYIAAGAAAALAVPAAIWNKRGWLILLAFAALGTLLLSVRAMEEPLEGRYAVSGRVCETPIKNDSGWTVTLDQACAGGAARRQRLRLYIRGKAAPVYGDYIEAEATLSTPDAAYQSGYAYAHISSTGFAQGFHVTGQAAPDAYGALLRLRASLSERIDRLFAESGGLAAGMLLGDKSGIEDRAMDAYRLSGAAHLLAVSGLHVSTLAGALSMLIRRRAWLRFGLLAAFLAFYCAITAFSPSVLRASVMLLAWQLSYPLRMHEDRISALSLAFMAVLLVNPYALFYVGFQLSFLAAYGLALIAPMLRDRFSRLGSSLSGVLSGSLAVWIAALPAQAAFFQTVSLASLVINLFILPLVPLFLIPAFVLTCLSFVSFPLAETLAFLPRWALMAIDVLARAPAAVQLSIGAPHRIVTLLYMAAILFGSRLCMRPRLFRAACALACLSAAAVLWA